MCTPKPPAFCAITYAAGGQRHFCDPRETPSRLRHPSRFATAIRSQNILYSCSCACIPRWPGERPWPTSKPEDRTILPHPTDNGDEKSWKRTPAERWRVDEYRHTPFDLLDISAWWATVYHHQQVRIPKLPMEYLLYFPPPKFTGISTDPYLEPTRSIVIDDSVFFYAGIHRATRAKLLSDIDRQRLHAARCAACFRYGDGDEVTLRGL